MRIIGAVAVVLIFGAITIAYFVLHPLYALVCLVLIYGGPLIAVLTMSGGSTKRGASALQLTVLIIGPFLGMMAVYALDFQLDVFGVIPEDEIIWRALIPMCCAGAYYGPLALRR